ETDNSGARSVLATYEVKSARPISAILGIQASTDTSGVRQIGYEMSFGAGAPPASGNIENPDPNDDEPPRVARSSPGSDETLGTTQPVTLEFNEPIRKEVTTHPDAI